MEAVGVRMEAFGQLMQDFANMQRLAAFYSK
jgi:hypothetical protein